VRRPRIWRQPGGEEILPDRKLDARSGPADRPAPVGRVGQGKLGFKKLRRRARNIVSRRRLLLVPQIPSPPKVYRASVSGRLLDPWKMVSSVGRNCFFGTRLSHGRLSDGLRSAPQTCEYHPRKRTAYFSLTALILSFLAYRFLRDVTERFLNARVWRPVFRVSRSRRALPRICRPSNLMSRRPCLQRTP
jgi:hypothetical protein